PGLAILGAAAGAIVAYGTRRTIQPRMPNRYGRGTLAGAIALPLALAIGQFPHLTTNPTATRWAIGFVLLTGVAAMIVYYQWRKRRTLRRRAAYTAQRVSASR